MALKLSTGLINKMMDTGSFKSIFENAADGFMIDIFSGTRPADADAATGNGSTATLLVTVSNGASGLTFEATATAGQLEKNAGETWQGTAAATGTASWFRVRLKTGDSASGTLSTTLPRVDGSVSTSGADMNLGSVTVTSGAPFVLSTASFTLPSA
jgi:hypothetical protein